MNIKAFQQSGNDKGVPNISTYNKLLKVAFAYDGVEFGGVEIHLLNLLKYLDKKRFQPLVIVMPGANSYLTPAKFIEALHKMQIPVLTPAMYAKGNKSNSLKDVLNLVKLFKTEKIDLIHFHTSNLNGGRKVSIAARLAGVKVFLRSEHIPPSDNFKPQHRFTIIPTDMLTTKIIVGSETCKKEQIGYLKRNPSKLITSYYGIEVEKFRPVTDTREHKVKLGLDPDLPVIGTVGRLVKQKGQIHLINAAPEVIKRYGAVNFILVGSGPLEGGLRKRAKELGIERYVHFMGFAERTEPYISAMDIAVMTSINEGISLAMLEYMAMAKPVVSSDEGSFVETIIDDESGLIFPRANPEILAHKLTYLLQNPDKAREIGQAAIKRVNRFFNVRYQTNQLMNLYSEEFMKREYPGLKFTNWMPVIVGLNPLLYTICEML